jgi:tRNA (cmo5U34)-methyltransferase
MNEFDIKAADWEKNPMHWERSEVIAKEIKELIPLRTDMKAMEYGAGTGITSFLLKDYLKEITLMDSSAEMIKVMNEKIKTAEVKNLQTLCFDLEQNDYELGKFDFIFTQMVLHHVTKIDTILKRFYNLLNPGGFLAIADLYEEDGSFHGEGFTGHRGFNPENLSRLISKHHFTNISHKPCFIINRKVSDSETVKFEVFLMISKRA